MKLVIASDLHGSATATRELVDRIEEESPDRVALLGDLLYHGPRNNLPEGHAPREVARILNGFAGRIVAVRGTATPKWIRWCSTSPAWPTTRFWQTGRTRCF